MSETTASAKAAEKEKTGPKTRRSGGHRSSADPSFNMEELRELAALVDEHGFTDFEFENENIRAFNKVQLYLSESLSIQQLNLTWETQLPQEIT